MYAFVHLCVCMYVCLFVCTFASLKMLDVPFYFWMWFFPVGTWPYWRIYSFCLYVIIVTICLVYSTHRIASHEQHMAASMKSMIFFHEVSRTSLSLCGQPLIICTQICLTTHGDQTTVWAGRSSPHKCLCFPQAQANAFSKARFISSSVALAPN